MEEAVDILIDKYRAIFAEINDRLVSFAPYQHENDTGRTLYRAWFSCYEAGVKELQQFERIFDYIQEGQIEKAREALNLPRGAAQTQQKTQKTILYTILCNDVTPYKVFYDRAQEENRRITASLIEIGRESDTETANDVEMIASWICTFPYTDEAGEPGEETSWTKKIAKAGALAGLGFLAGRYL